MVLEQDKLTMKATSAYVNDKCVNEVILPADEVKSKQESFGLTIKDPMRLKEGTLVLRLEVWLEHNSLRWKWGRSVPELPVTLTRRVVFSTCRKLVGYFLVCRWLRVVARTIKRLASMVNECNDTVKDVPSSNWWLKYRPEYAKMTLPEEFGTWPEKKWMHRLMQTFWQWVGYWRVMVLYWKMRASFVRLAMFNIST